MITSARQRCASVLARSRSARQSVTPYKGTISRKMIFVCRVRKIAAAVSTEPDVSAERRFSPPRVDERQQHGDEEERVNMTENAVVDPIVKEVGAKRHRRQRRERDGRGEVANEQAAQDGEPGQQIHQPGETRRVLVVGRKPVGQELRPAGQHMRGEEKRRDQQGRADRMRIDPAIGARPPSDARELRVSTAGKGTSLRLEGRVAAQKPRRQVDIVAVAVRAYRSGGVWTGVDGGVAGKREHAGDGDEMPYKKSVCPCTHERAL